MVRTRNYHIYRNAQKKDILKSYRKLAMQWHPDKFESEDEKKEAEKKFMDIAAAKEVLSDPGMYTFTIYLFILWFVTRQESHMWYSSMRYP